MDILSYILGKKAGGGGGEAVLVNKNISANGTYNASDDAADGYKKVVVDVPNSYGAGDEGKVVSNGALVAQGSASYTANGTYDTTKVNSATVQVGGAPEAEWNDVCFWDYDGKLLYSYSAAEFANLSALPPNPSHEGLTAQGWNWTLADAKTHVATYGMLDIGQLYITDNGKTRVHVAITDSLRPNVFVRIKCSVTGALTLNWGDGSATETNADTAETVYEHSYMPGEYVIEFGVSSGTVTLGGGTGEKGFLAGNNSIIGGRNPAHPYDVWSRASARAIEIGDGVVLSSNCFVQQINCRTLTMPNSIIYADNANYFQGMPSLIMLILPIPYGAGNDPGSFDQYAGKAVCFPNQSKLTASWSSLSSYTVRRICIPIYANGNQARLGKGVKRFFFSEDLTSIPAIFSQEPFSIERLDFPASLTSIGGFDANFYSLKEVHCYAETPPSIVANLFSKTPTDLVIYVPYSADHSVLNAYKTASNWSTYASYMQEEPQ